MGLWADVGGFVAQTALPILGGVVGGPLGMFIGGALGSMASDLIHGHAPDLTNALTNGGLSLVGGAVGGLVTKGVGYIPLPNGKLAKIGDWLISPVVKGKETWKAGDGLKALATTGGRKPLTLLGAGLTPAIFGPGLGAAEQWEGVWIPNPNPTWPKLADKVELTGGVEVGYLFRPNAMSDPSLKTWYDKLAQLFGVTWVGFGGESGTLPTAPPTITPPAQVGAVPGLAASSELGKLYNAQALALKGAIDAFVKTEQDIGKLVKDNSDSSAQQATTGQANVLTALDAIDVSMLKAQKEPNPGLFMQLIAEGLQTVQGVAADAAGKAKETAGEVDATTAKLNEALGKIDKLTNQVLTLTDQNRSLKSDLDLAKASGAAAQQAAANNSRYLPNDTGRIYNPDTGTINDTNPNTSGSGSGLGDTSGTSGGLGGTSGGLGDTSGTMPPASPYDPTGAGAGAMGSDLMSSMLPLLLSGMLGQNQLGSGLLDPDDTDRGRRRYEDDIVPPSVVAPPAPQAPAAAGPSDPHAGSNAQQASTGPQSGATAQPAGAVPPGRIAGADGTVTYTFPDGRTQKVSPVVATALDAAFGNASATDAEKALGKAGVKWESEKKPGGRVDPYQVMTGDVSKWEHGSALAVAFPGDSAGSGGTLEVIINGQMVPFSSDMQGGSGQSQDQSTKSKDGKGQDGLGLDGQSQSSPSQSGKGDEGKVQPGTGDFGEWVGFFHPVGIEAVTTHAPDGGVPGSTPADPSAGASAAVPVVAAVPS